MKVKQFPLYLLLAPSFICLVVFVYIPMYGIVLSAKNFTISGGILGSPWAKPLWANFWWMKDSEFWNVVGNTIRIAAWKFACSFPVPIILALMLNEVRNRKFKRITQTIIYLPHFVSWVIFSGIIYQLLSNDPASPLSVLLGVFGRKPVNILGSDRAFLPILVVSNIIKEAGWGTILYLAAISGIDPQLYEAATVDGCNNWQKAVNITFPGIIPTVMIMLILSVPSILSAGFDQIWNMSNSMVARSTNVLDIYILKVGIQGGRYSYGIAIDFVVKVMSFSLVLLTNKLSKQGLGYGIW